jgi:mycothiol synthase
VRLLMRAYPELAGWYADGFAVLCAAPWFRAEDLLLLESTASDGALLGLHWMKRRSAGVGEVYNLAVDPDAQGRGYGPLLLDAGLAHLVAVGSREVVLWVDAANPRALELYRSRGFTPRWDDVSLAG